MGHIAFITSNAAKVRLADERLKPYGVSVGQRTLELEEIQSFDVAEVARHKARQAMQKAEEPFFVEDSGLYIKALNGFPGPMIKPVITRVGEDRLTKMVGTDDSREVEVIGVIAYGDPIESEISIFEGFYAGTIAEKPHGDNTRGWLLSRIFIPHGWNQTLAELDDGEWNRFLEDFRRNDHFDKLGKWLSDQYKR